MKRLVSLFVLIGLIGFLGITFFQILAPFLLPLFLAAILAVICQPVFRYFLRKTSNRMHLAAGLTTLSLLTLVLVPLSIGTFTAALQLYLFAERTLDDPQWAEALKEMRTRLDVDRAIDWINRHTAAGGQIDPATIERQVQSSTRAILGSIGERTLGIAASTLGVLGAVVSAIISFLMFVVAFYYMLADGPRLIEATEELIPVHIEYQRQLLTQFTNIIRAVLLATFVAAIGQGMATAIGLAVVGFGHFFVFAIVATLAALIPLAGTWMVWVPCAAWLGWNGHWGKAIFLTIYGLAFVGMLDNVIRTYVLQSNAKLHPLLAFVSVLGGVQVMGLWGVFIGPMVACCLHALVKIFNTELRVFSQEKWLRWLETSTPDLRATASPALMAKLGPGLTVSSPPPAAAPPTSPGAPLPKVEP